MKRWTSLPRCAHICRPSFLWATVPGFQDRLWSINIHSHHSQEQSGKESLCVRDWAWGERESERPRGRPRGQAKALFVLILAHELGFSHTQPDSLHWIRPYRTRLLSRTPYAVFFPPATYCTHVKKPKTWLKPRFSLRETVGDYNLKGIIHTKISIFCHYLLIFTLRIQILHKNKIISIIQK